MTIKEFKKLLEEYTDDTIIKIAHYGMKGIITETFDIDIVGDYTDQEEKHILLG